MQSMFGKVRRRQELLNVAHQVLRRQELLNRPAARVPFSLVARLQTPGGVRPNFGRVFCS